MPFAIHLETIATYQSLFIMILSRWQREREGGTTETTSNAAQMLGALHPTSAGRTDSSNLLAGATNDARASPAYYPPRQTRTIHHNSSSGGGGTTVRPIKVLEGHEEGAVFDVKWRDGTMVSAGEDGAVGIWGVSAVAA